MGTKPFYIFLCTQSRVRSTGCHGTGCVHPMLKYAENIRRTKLRTSAATAEGMGNYEATVNMTSRSPSLYCLSLTIMM
jgi:hypothetical protein